MLAFTEGAYKRGYIGEGVSDLASKDTSGRLQEHGRLLERLRYMYEMISGS